MLVRARLGLLVLVLLSDTTNMVLLVKVAFILMGLLIHLRDGIPLVLREGRKVEEGCISPFCVCLLLQFSFTASFKIIPILT